MSLRRLLLSLGFVLCLAAAMMAVLLASWPSERCVTAAAPSVSRVLRVPPRTSTCTLVAYPPATVGETLALPPSPPERSAPPPVPAADRASEPRAAAPEPESSEGSDTHPRTLRFAGRVVFPDGIPVSSGTIRISFYLSWTYRQPGKGWRLPGRHNLCENWTGTLERGTFEGSVTLLIPDDEVRHRNARGTKPQMGIFASGPDFLQVQAEVVIAEDEDVVLTGHLYDPVPECRLLGRAALPDERAWPPLTVARGSQVTVLLPGAFTYPPAKDDSSEPWRPALHLRSAPPGSWPPSIEGDSIAAYGNDWEIRFPPAPAGCYEFSWLVRKGVTGDFTASSTKRSGQLYYRFLQLEDGVVQVVDLRSRAFGDVLIELRDDTGSPWSLPAIIRWRPVPGDDEHAPASVFRSSGCLDYPGGDGRCAIPDLLPGRYEFSVSTAEDRHVTAPWGQFIVAKEVVDVEDERRSVVRLAFAHPVITTTAVAADDLPIRSWRLDCYAVYDRSQTRWKGWYLHWDHARDDTWHYDKEKDVLRLYVPVSDPEPGALNYIPGPCSFPRFAAPAWWRAFPEYAPDRWLDFEGHIGSGIPERNDGVIRFSAGVLPQQQAFVLYATAGERTVAQYFPAGAPAGPIVFRFPSP